jgi:hypothetical protein
MTTDEVAKIKHIIILCNDLLMNHALSNDVSSDGGEQLTITKQLLSLGMSRNNGFSREQIVLLGERYPLKKGWMRRLLGKPISTSNYQKFVELRNAHLSN